MAADDGGDKLFVCGTAAAAGDGRVQPCAIERLYSTYLLLQRCCAAIGSRDGSSGHRSEGAACAEVLPLVE
jgi:hypothetical protein